MCGRSAAGSCLFGRLVCQIGASAPTRSAGALSAVLATPHIEEPRFSPDGGLTAVVIESDEQKEGPLP